SGPTVPYLFGRARTAGGPNPSATWNAIGNGITVRATAITDARPAVAIGTPPVVSGLGQFDSNVNEQFQVNLAFNYAYFWNNYPALTGANGGSVPLAMATNDSTLNGLLVFDPSSTPSGSNLVGSSSASLTVGIGTAETSISVTDPHVFLSDPDNDPTKMYHIAVLTQSTDSTGSVKGEIEVM